MWSRSLKPVWRHHIYRVAAPLHQGARTLDPQVLDRLSRRLAGFEAVLRDNAGVTMLVNNAGVGSVASILQADVDAMTAMIDLNVTALTRLSYAAAPAFVARGVGTIVNISSAVAIAVEALNGVYSA